MSYDLLLQLLPKRPVFPALLCYLTSEIKASRFEYVPLCFPYLFAGVLRRRVTRSVGGFVLKRRHFISFHFNERGRKVRV